MPDAQRVKRYVRSRLLCLFALGTCILPLAAVAQTIPAFPGAEGAGAFATGGRGGIVYHVTKLDKNFNHNEPGTLRYGLTDSNFAGQHRTIVFDVAGTFWLGRYGAERNHHNGWDTQSRLNLGSNVTIAGQTAPGPVRIMGGVVKAGGNNAILRNVSIAPGYGMRNFEQPDADPPVPPTPGDFPDSYVYDAIDITGTNIMIDHISTFYATDETISANELANNVTVQYSNISQGQNYPQLDAEGGSYTGHALGSLLQAGSNARLSIHHNLYAHLKGRLPRVGSEVGTGAFNDFRNNVFYNWLSTAGGGASGQPSFNNFVGNFYLAGPGGDDAQGGSSTNIVNRAGGTGIFNGSSSSVTRVYHTGNIKDTNKNGAAQFTTSLTNSDFGSSNFQVSPLWYQGQATYTGVTDTAAAAYDRVLRYMGSLWWTRDYDYMLGNVAAIDSVDERIIHETATGTGKIMAWADDPFNNDPNEGVEWRHLLSFRADPTTGAAPFNHPANWDTDGDGMPGIWEMAHGLNPAIADNNGDFDSDGFTNLEEYINEVGEWPAPQPIKFNGATNDRYAQITNWDVNSDPLVTSVWQPSKYDTAIIDNGTVVVDAVGQHAGNFLLGTNAGDNATLDITSGWLLVEDAPQGISDGVTVIGDHSAATATLNLSGGLLATKTLLKGAGGTFNFTGGVLSAQSVNFDLVNNGGILAPGNSPGSTIINGDFTTNSGALEIELASAGSFDTVAVTGDVALGGNLLVKLLNNFVPDDQDLFTILSGGTISGSFANLNPNGRINIDGADGSFLVTIGSDQVMLSNFLLAPPVLAGDYNDDGVVDAADYVVWRKFAGTTGPLPNETESLGEIDEEDHDAWLANFGASGGGGAAANTPEPSTSLLALAALFVTLPARQYRTSLAPAFKMIARGQGE
jgi:hypothetical protein